MWTSFFFFLRKHCGHSDSEVKQIRTLNLSHFSVVWRMGADSTGKPEESYFDKRVLCTPSVLFCYSPYFSEGKMGGGGDFSWFLT